MNSITTVTSASLKRTASTLGFYLTFFGLAVGFSSPLLLSDSPYVTVDVSVDDIAEFEKAGVEQGQIRTFLLEIQTEQRAAGFYAGLFAAIGVLLTVGTYIGMLSPAQSRLDKLAMRGTEKERRIDAEIIIKYKSDIELLELVLGFLVIASGLSLALRVALPLKDPRFGLSPMWPLWLAVFIAFLFGILALKRGMLIKAARQNSAININGESLDPIILENDKITESEP